MAVSTPKSKSKSAAQAPASIPLAIRDPQPPKVASAGDLLKSLTAKTPVAKAPAKTRPEVKLTPEAEKVMRNFAPAKTLFDFLEAHLNNLKAAVKDLVFPLYVETMWKQKSQPASPTIKVERESDGKPDVEATYIVQARWKVNADSPEAAHDYLVNLGLSPVKAGELIENELSFDPMTTLRPFNELVKGRKEGEGWINASAEEQAVAVKLLSFVQGIASEPLTETERALVLRSEPNVVVKDGFLERAATYADSVEQLAAIFQVITPVAYVKGAKFGISDTLEERTNRLLDSAKEILGIAK